MDFLKVITFFKSYYIFSNDPKRLRRLPGNGLYMYWVEEDGEQDRWTYCSVQELHLICSSDKLGFQGCVVSETLVDPGIFIF